MKFNYNLLQALSCAGGVEFDHHLGCDVVFLYYHQKLHAPKTLSTVKTCSIWESGVKVGHHNAAYHP